MAKRPTRPVSVVDVPIDIGVDAGSGRQVGVAHHALILNERLTQRFEEHVATNSDQLDNIRDSIGDVRKDVRDVNSHVGNLRVDVGKMSSVVDNINETLDEQQQMRHVQMIAAVETSKAEKIAKIDNRNDRKKAVRTLMLKIAVLVVGLLGTAAGMLIEHCR